MFKMCLSPGKGRGLFATQDIPRGTRLVAEPATITSPLVGTTDLWKQVDKLSPSQWEDFMSLAMSPLPPNPFMFQQTHARLAAARLRGAALENAVLNEVKARIIYLTNCSVTGQEGDLGSGVFLLNSCLNYSCTPNVQFAFNPGLGKGTVHAIRDIKEGEELFSNYVDCMRPPTVRAKELLRWGIECDCNVCTGPDAAKGNVRRSRGFEIGAMICKGTMGDFQMFVLGYSPVAGPKTDAHALVLAEECVGIFEAEDLFRLGLAAA